MDDRSDDLGRRPLLAGMAMAALPVAASAVEPSFDTLLSQARRDRTLEIWLGSPTAGQIHRALFTAFQHRFGLAFDGRWVVLHAVRANTRLMVEATARRVSCDLLGGSADNIALLESKGLIRQEDWIARFSSILPTIIEPVDRMMPTLRGLGLSWFDVAYGTAWNTNAVTEAEAPRRLTDFLDPKWRGRFAMSVLGGSPFDLLSLAVGQEATLSLVKGLLANQPILKAGVPAVVSALTTGEAHLAIGAYTTVERARRNGEPQAFRFFDDYLPVLPLFVSIPTQAPHPALARLFAAWLVTEGAQIVETMEGAGRISDPTSALGKAVRALPAGIRVLEERSIADIEQTRAITARIHTMFSSHRG